MSPSSQVVAVVLHRDNNAAVVTVDDVVLQVGGTTTTAGTFRCRNHSNRPDSLSHFVLEQNQNKSKATTVILFFCCCLRFRTHFLRREVGFCCFVMIRARDKNGNACENDERPRRDIRGETKKRGQTCGCCWLLCFAGELMYWKKMSSGFALLACM